jgi:hypothetical protein
VKGKMKNEPQNRPRTLETTSTGEPRPPRHRKTQHNKHNNLDEKRKPMKKQQSKQQPNGSNTYKRTAI